MSFDATKCFDVENGIAIEDLGGNTVILSGGSGSPVGIDAPIGTRYHQIGGPTWAKVGAGVNDWSSAGSFPYNHNPVPTDNSYILLWNPSSNAWEPSTKLRHRSWVPVPDNHVISLNGILNLAAGSNYLHFFTGSASGYRINLPDARTLETGYKFELTNTTSNTIAVYLNTGTLLFTLSQNATGWLTLQDNSTQAGTWNATQVMLASIASGIISYNMVSSSVFTTTSNSDVLITGFQLTPQAGQYAAWYSACSFMVNTPYTHYWSIYRAGAQVTDSERRQDTAHSNQYMSDSTQTIVTVNGAQTVDVRVRTTSSKSLSVYQRSLLLIRLGTG